MTTAHARVAEIGTTLQAIQSGWPFFLVELNARIDALTEQLIGHESEQTRGRIHALRDIRDMPLLLQQERDSISAALADQAAAD